MSSDLAPRLTTPSGGPLPGDNSYKAIQAKLTMLARAMDDAAVDLEGLERRMRRNASHTEDVARDITHADLDKRFIELTNLVASALGGAAVEVRTLHRTATENVDEADQAKKTHADLYGELDDIRSGREHKTPRPGFFD